MKRVFLVSDPKKGGRPAFDKVMMLKVLVLQRISTLSMGIAAPLARARVGMVRVARGPDHC
ncbi:MAG: hypothetical protein IPK99_10970 [Flavobacteriales bacterium]|nr:hypothetical protein [Flavobacteriales bacterium]